MTAQSQKHEMKRKELKQTLKPVSVGILVINHELIHEGLVTSRGFVERMRFE